jgi:hypothetical protein
LRFLLCHSAFAPGADPPGAARPDRGLQQADNRLVGGVDRYRRMQKKSRRLAIPRRTQPATRPRPAAEIDLGRVLRHDDPLSATAFPSAPIQGRNDLPGAHLPRIKKPMRRNFAGPIAPNLAQAQRSSRNNPLKQPSPARRTAR